MMKGITRNYKQDNKIQSILMALNVAGAMPHMNPSRI